MGAIPILLIVWPALAAAVPALHPEPPGARRGRLCGGGRRDGPGVGTAGRLDGGRRGPGRAVCTDRLVDHAMLAGEVFLMGLIVLLSIRHHKYPIILLSAGQTLLAVWTELAHPAGPAAHMRVDGLAILLCIIAAFVGGFICI